MQVKDLVEKYLSGPGASLKTRAETERLIRRHVLPILGHMDTAAVDYDALSWMMRKLERTPVQANRALAVTSQIMVWAVRWKLRTDNPCQWVQRYPEESRVRCLTGAERQSLLEALAAEHIEAGAFLRLLYYTGARVSEVARMRWENVDWTNGRVSVGEGKNRDRRVIYLPPAGLDELWGLCGGRHIGPVFKAGIDKRSEKAWRRIRKAAGLPGLRRHDLRHAFASSGLSAGLTLPQVGELLGHRSVSSTKRYAHLAADEGADLVTRVGEKL